MLEFMERVQASFYKETGWNRENSYSNLNATADAILGFQPPRGLRFTLSSLATAHFAASYQLGTVGVVDGSIAYLFSTVPLASLPSSESVDLQNLLCSYRMLTPLHEFRRQWPSTVQPDIPPFARSTAHRPVPNPPKDAPAETGPAQVPHEPKQREQDSERTQRSAPVMVNSHFRGMNDTAEHQPAPVGPSLAHMLETVTALLFRAADALHMQYQSIVWTEQSMLYGRMYLPDSRLEALILRRLTPTVQGQLRAVSQDSIRNGGTLLGLLQYDNGKFGAEGLASTDGGVLGMRGLYNFGGDSSPQPRSSKGNSPYGTNGGANGNGSSYGSHHHSGRSLSDRIFGRSSVGAEVYYGILNKSGGMSVGARFSTLPTNLGIPLTATATCNPLMGNFSCTYSVGAGRSVSIASRFDWNVYSYESAWVIGVELWRKREITPKQLPPDEKEQEVEVAGDEDVTARKLVFAERDPTPRATRAWRKAERSKKAKLEWKTDEEIASEEAQAEEMRLRTMDPHIGVLKVRLDQHLRIGLVWQGRVKSLLFSVGTAIDLRRLTQPFRTLGLEVTFSS